MTVEIGYSDNQHTNTTLNNTQRIRQIEPDSLSLPLLISLSLTHHNDTLSSCFLLHRLLDERGLSSQQVRGFLHKARLGGGRSVRGRVWVSEKSKW